MLQNQFVPELKRKGLLLSCHFMQDGAPAHTSLRARTFLNDTFQDRWVGKFGPVPWPARSPDLTSCDNALWGILKPKIVAHKTVSAERLKEIIKHEFQTFPQDVLKAVNNRTFRRMRLCVEKGGLQVDPYDN